MINTVPDLPQSVKRFIELRLARDGVSAVLLYGSYARGTQHAKSDVDVVYIVDSGFNSECVEYEGLLFEVLEQTKHGMFEYWQKHMDVDRHWYLWKDAKVIYDREGEGAEVIEHAMSLVGQRHPWSREKVENHKLAMLAKIENIRYLSRKDAGTAAILLVEFVRLLTENWFKMRGQFVPSTKVILSLFAEHDPEFGSMLVDYHLNADGLDRKFEQVETMLNTVYS